MSQPTHMPVEPIAYEVRAADDAWPKVIRVMAILGMMLAVGRLIQAVSISFYLFGLPPFTSVQLASAQWAAMWLRFGNGIVFGAVLMIGATGLFQSRPWARPLLLIGEGFYFVSVVVVSTLGMMSGSASLRPSEMLFASISILGTTPLQLAYPLAIYLLFRGRRLGPPRV